MKAIRIILVLVCHFCLNSCNNDENEQIEANGIMGSYKVTSYTYKGFYFLTGPNIETPIRVDFTGIGKNFDYRTEIRERPNTWVFSGTFDADVTRLSDGVVFNDTNIQVDPISYMWTKNGDTIILTAPDGKTTNVSVLDGNNKYMIVSYSSKIIRETQGFTYDITYSEHIIRLDRNQ